MASSAACLQIVSGSHEMGFDAGCEAAHHRYATHPVLSILTNCQSLTPFHMRLSSELEIENTISREQKFWTPVFCHELLQFANESAPHPVPAVDLHNASCLKTLAWVVRYVVPHVTVRPAAMLASLDDFVPIQNYVTVSDIAFAFIVLEHGLCSWREEC